MKNITKLLILFVIFGIGILGFFAGKKIGRNDVNKEMMHIINRIYPAPPQNLLTTGGKITDIYGTKITLEINDPEDYLPHSDGSPYKKLERDVKVGSKTEIIKIDYNNYQPDGGPLREEISLSNLSKGDNIIIKTFENIRTNKNLTAKKIELIIN